MAQALLYDGWEYRRYSVCSDGVPRSDWWCIYWASCDALPGIKWYVFFPSNYIFYSKDRLLQQLSFDCMVDVQKIQVLAWVTWRSGHLCEAQFIYLQNGDDDSYLSGSLSLGAFTEKRPWSHVLRSTRKAFCTHGYTPEKENKQMLGLPSCLYLLEKRDSAGSDGNSMWSGVIVYGRWPRPNLLDWARINRHAEARMNSGHIPGVFRILRCSNDQKGFLFI